MKKIVLVLLSAFVFTTAVSSLSRKEIADIKVSKKGNFKYWAKSSETLNTLVTYVKDVTNPKSKNFIPVENRIAVFDMDGTLICETAPTYIEHMTYRNRFVNDPAFKPTEKQLEVYNNIKSATEQGLPSWQFLGQESSDMYASYVGMSNEEYFSYQESFLEQEVDGLTNLKWGEIFYLPMVEVISYLQANDFTCYIVTACERDLCRVLACDVLHIAKNNVIGSEVFYVSPSQGEDPNWKYIFKKGGDSVVRGNLKAENGQMEKVCNIVKEIGIQPVLGFGNSSGDESMLNYVLTDNKYKSLSFLVLPDDTEREYGSPDKAASLSEKCKNNDWIPVSMKNDFKTIYGDTVGKR